MIKRIQLREILAWMTLVIALILFGATIVFAQTKTIHVDNDNGKVHIKINSTEDGKTTKFDTTFTITDDGDIEKVIEDLDGKDGNTSVYVYKNGSKKGDDHDIKIKKKHLIIDSGNSKISDEEIEKLQERLSESMKNLKHNLGKMEKSLKEYNIHIDKDFSEDMLLESEYDIDVMDSLIDKDHIVIHGNHDENPPVFEKVVTTKNGNKLFVYKRSESASKSESMKKDRNLSGQKSENWDIKNAEIFPNPTNGKFKISFFTEDNGDLTIQVLDGTSKVVFNEKLNNFEGEYSREIDLSDKSKGTYILKISQGGKIINKKIVLE